MNWEISDNIKIGYICGGVGMFNNSFKGGLYEDAAMYDLRYKVIDKLKNRPNIEVYYKIGYNTERYKLSLEEEIVKGSWGNIKAISTRQRLLERLGGVDLFVLEMPSTPLFEVLTTSKPVVVLVDPRALSLTSQAAQLLQNRVTIVKSKNEMLLCIDDIVEKGREAKAFIVPDHNDKTFITRYATCGDYKSIDRTVDFLKSVIRNDT